MQLTNQLNDSTKYPAKQHAQRVAAGLGCKEGLIYLLGQYAYNKEDSDMPKTWCQRRFFYYMSGVDEANSCLTYDCREDRLVLYIEEIDWDRLVWFGRGSTIEEAKEKYDVDDVRWNPQLFSDIRHWQSKSSKDARMFILHEDHVPKGLEGLSLDSKRLLPVMDECRAVKDRYEVGLIEKASEISKAAHMAVLQHVASALNEAQLSAIFQEECISRFAPQAYPPIVGSGPNASTLHYSANNESLEGRQLLCIDAGAAYQLYASDVTRTFPINGRWTKEARAIYDLVLEIQNNAIAASKPGTHMIDLHNQVARSSIEGLLKLGILHGGSADEIEQAGTIRGFYPHGLGHHVGLETHDCESLPFLRYPKGSFNTERFHLSPCRSDSPKMQPGYVITIEPGLYFNRQHLTHNYLRDPKHARYINTEVLDRYWDVGGVRIEDDILITRGGNRNLTSVPKDPDVLSEIILEGLAEVQRYKRALERSF